MRRVSVLASLGALIFLSFASLACEVIMPPAPKPGPTRIGSEDHLWANLELACDDFVGIARLDCPKVSKVLLDTGLCHPVQTVIGRGLSCPILSPAETLDFYCLTMDEVPAVYVELRYEATAKAVEFNRHLGACNVYSEGPVAGKAERYPTDKGYRVCLFEDTSLVFKSERLALDDAKRPVGLYLDLVGNQVTSDRVDGPLDAPLGLVLDARLLDAEARQAAFDSVCSVFFHLREQMKEND